MDFRLPSGIDHLPRHKERLVAACRMGLTEHDVVGMAIAGSFVGGAPDSYSDLDLRVVLANGSFGRVFPRREELARANQGLASVRSTPAEPTRPPPSRETPRVENSTTTTVMATPLARSSRVHTIAVGETLSGISRQYYGTANRWSDILAANRDILRDERSLIAGRTLRIPE